MQCFWCRRVNMVHKKLVTLFFFFKYLPQNKAKLLLTLTEKDMSIYIFVEKRFRNYICFIIIIRSNIDHFLSFKGIHTKYKHTKNLNLKQKKSDPSPTSPQRIRMSTTTTSITAQKYNRHPEFPDSGPFSDSQRGNF